MTDLALTFSIITVCLNSEKTIARTLESIARQSYPHKSSLVIDGSSQDGTLQVVRTFSELVSVLISEPDKNLYEAMNKGLRYAKGNIIGFLNADDHYAHTEVLSEVAACFQDPAVGACFSDLVYFSPGAPDRVVRYWRSSRYQPGHFAKGWSPPHPTFFVRRALYEQYGGFDTHMLFGNDVELMMRFLEKHRIQSRYVPAVWVKMQTGGISNRSFRNRFLQNKEIVAAAKRLGIAFSLWPFLIGKITDRLRQRIEGTKHA